MEDKNHTEFGETQNPLEYSIPRPNHQPLGDIGKCIYCSSTTDLTEEHIIPFGLNGPWTLRNASCKECNKITSKFENETLHNGLIITRSALNFNTRHKKKMPNSFEAKMDNGFEQFTVKIPKSDVPVLYYLPIFLPPAVLDNRPYTNGIQGNGNFFVKELRGINKKKMARINGNGKITLNYSLNIVDFARMIGKIGYCLGVAHFGIDNIEEKGLVSSILGKKDEIGRWVGSPTDSQISNNEALHTYSMEFSFDYVTFDGTATCRIGLLSCFGTPEYIVYLGKIKNERFKTLWENDILGGAKES